MQENPLSSVELLSRVQIALDEFITPRLTVLETTSPDSLVLGQSLHTYIQGGKRLRPAFAYWGYRSVGLPDCEAIIQAASSLEFLQACALIHDDVMDDSHVRRGKPAMHKHFEQLHRDAGWGGSAELFGIGTAILVGDLALSWADEMLLLSNFETSAINRAKAIYDTMRTELMAGQYLDLLEQSRKGTTADSARNVIRYKSAKYSIERPLHIGAALGGADESHMAVLSAYGLAIGEAFQLRDDLLGVFGQSDVTGKPQGDDLREGKQTVLIAYAREYDHQPTHTLLDEHLGNPNLNTSQLEDIHTALHETGAVARVESDIERLTHNALVALESDSIPTETRTALKHLAYLATQRTS